MDRRAWKELFQQHGPCVALFSCVLVRTEGAECMAERATARRHKAIHKATYRADPRSARASASNSAAFSSAMLMYSGMRAAVSR